MKHNHAWLRTEIQKKIEFQTTQIEFWESEEAESHNLANFCSQLATEWRVSRGTLFDVLLLLQKSDGELQQRKQNGDSLLSPSRNIWIKIDEVLGETT